MRPSIGPLPRASAGGEEEASSGAGLAGREGLAPYLSGGGEPHLPFICILCRLRGPWELSPSSGGRHRLDHRRLSSKGINGNNSKTRPIGIGRLGYL